MKKYETFPLFEIKEEVVVVPVEQRVEKALRNVRRLFIENYPVVLAFSGGKDSGLVVAIALHAASEIAALISRQMVFRRIEDSRCLGKALRNSRNLKRSARLTISLTVWPSGTGASSGPSSYRPSPRISPSIT
ncbi:MAG: hypothetical protein QOC89_4067 [Paraburkholderia sp.]|jgi:DNA sulfur modification protein DndC|nr:hypothetical protein [Paraburkholderia sp.]MEA3128225.1 hypothetical protein [Paraburkholderia sp.]